MLVTFTKPLYLLSIRFLKHIKKFRGGAKVQNKEAKEKKVSKYWEIFYNDDNRVTSKWAYDVTIDRFEVSFINIINNKPEKIPRERYVRRIDRDKIEVSKYLASKGISKGVDELWT